MELDQLPGEDTGIIKVTPECTLFMQLRSRLMLVRVLGLGVLGR